MNYQLISAALFFCLLGLLGFLYDAVRERRRWKEEAQHLCPRCRTVGDPNPCAEHWSRVPYRLRSS